jgi:mannose-6-phosphate isomerase-like protein (cupin superfamily)
MYTIKSIAEMQSLHHGLVRLAAAELGVESFGMQVLELPAGFGEYPAHDHSEDGQEEVYVVLRGTAEFEIDGDRVPVQTGTMLRIEPASRRSIQPGEEGASILALGCVPGGGYERPEDFQLAVRS